MSVDSFKTKENSTLQIVAAICKVLSSRMQSILSLFSYYAIFEKFLQDILQYYSKNLRIGDMIMSKENCNRNGCVDVFRASLVKDAQFDSKYEIPKIKPENVIPERLIAFSEAIRSKDYEQFVHFYEDDVKFERIWNKPNKYLPKLKLFKGIITPDFSLYRDMPLAMQIYNTYRGKAIGTWLQSSGIHVIPNVRFSDERSFEFCCGGISLRSTIAIGSHGCIKAVREREFFKSGLSFVVNTLMPKTIIVYGSAPDSVFGKYEEMGIKITQFSSSFSTAHKEVNV